MHFKQKNKFFFFMPALLLMLLISGCGLLGTKNLPSSGNGSVGTGCLNDSKNLVGRYTAGTISQTEWTQAFQCINDSLDFFTQYVRGSVTNAYTQADMYTLVSQFLLTNRPISKNLMLGAFNLKAALFGGSTEVFTLDEVALLKTALGKLSDITGTLIPYLQLQNNPNATYSDYLNMVTAFKQAGDQIATFINTLPTGMMSSDALNLLLTELGSTLEISINTNLNSEFFLAKWLLFNTRKDALDIPDWALLFRTTLGVGGIALAFQASIGTDINSPQYQVMTRLHDDYHFREFIENLALQAKPYLDNMIAQHQGNIPFPLFDSIIESLPSSFFNTVPQNTLEGTLRPVFRKILQSSTQTGLDQPVLDSLYQILDRWVKNTGELDRVYEKMGLDRNSVTPDVFESALTVYGAGLTDPSEQASFQAMKNALVTTNPSTHQDQFTYAPMMVGDPTSVNYGYVLYQQGLNYSYYQNFIVVTLDPLVQQLIKTYATGNGVFLKPDFVNIFQDFADLLFALQIVDPTVPNFGESRFQDLTLFTPVSDGSSQVNTSEIIHYAMMIMSSGLLGDRMRAEITPMCNANIGTDNMGWTYVTAPCFRQQFNDRLTYWIHNFPRLSKYWATLTPAEQTQAMIWLEHGSRRDGYNDDDLGRYDFQALATVLHYTESLFTRFDGNFDEVLEKNEVNNAYPVFKNLLATKANISTSEGYILEGLFSYIVRYRTMPATDNLADIAKLGVWLIKYDLPTTNYSTDRMGVFNIVCQLAAPETQAQINATPTICAP